MAEATGIGGIDVIRGEYLLPVDTLVTETARSRFPKN